MWIFLLSVVFKAFEDLIRTYHYVYIYMNVKLYICDLCHEFCLFRCFVFLQFCFLIFFLIATNYTISSNFPSVFFCCFTFGVVFIFYKQSLYFRNGREQGRNWLPREDNDSFFRYQN